MKIIKENKICKMCGKSIRQRWYQSLWERFAGRTQKVSELDEMLFPDDNDFIMIGDESEMSSKKISIGNLKKIFK